MAAPVAGSLDQVGQLDQEMASLLSHHQDSVKRLSAASVGR
jgi:hypothetical protein